MTFGEKLYELRKERGMGQEELAGKLSVSRQSSEKILVLLFHTHHRFIVGGFSSA